MNWPRTTKPGGRDEPIDDPKIVEDALRMLVDSGQEFSIKVEGTSTLPYASILARIDPEPSTLVLKLVRPLPHELMAGAVFRMTFAVGDQRFEALISFLEREAYLQYRFSPPEHLFHADRRRHRRYPFRPRESAYVIAADGGIPGLGVAGSLVNIGMGGLCFRVDRVLRLEDGVRIPPSTALFERGASFPRVRIQDLPRLPLLEVSAWIAHSSERGSEILLGLQFGELGGSQASLLTDSLAFREKILQSRAGASHADGPSRSESGAHRSSTEASSDQNRSDASGEAMPDDGWALRLLLRRSARLMFIGTGGPLMEACQGRLWRAGYHRVTVVRDVETALGLIPESRPGLILLALAHAGDEEPLAALRQIEKQVSSLPDIPRVVCCDELDPTLFLGRAEDMHLLPLDEDEARWVAALDGWALAEGEEPDGGMG